MIDFLIFLAAGIGGAWLVNYLSDVLPDSRKLTTLQCAECGAELKWKSYLFNSACGRCGAGRSNRHWAVLILVPVLSVLVGIYPVRTLGEWGSISWLLYFSLVVVIDLEHRLILHPVSLVGGALALITGVLIHGTLNTLLGGGAGFGIMLAFYFLGELFIKFLARRRGEDIQEIALGFGDVNLAGIMGLLLGWPGVVGGIFLAVLLGGIVSGIYLVIQLIRKEYQAYQALPYGPFLAVSVFLLFYISQIVS